MIYICADHQNTCGERPCILYSDAEDFPPIYCPFDGKSKVFRQPGLNEEGADGPIPEHKIVFDSITGHVLIKHYPNRDEHDITAPFDVMAKMRADWKKEKGVS